jgi:microcystin-dependent protein
VRYYSNKATSAQLTADVTAGAAAFALDTVAGLPSDFPFTLVIDPDTISVEVVEVSAIIGTTCTVTRGKDGTTASEHSTGAVVIHAHTARDFSDSRVHENASAGIHGATGTLVGTTDAQTLTNKNLTSATNSFPTTFVTLAGVQTLTSKNLTSNSNVFPTSVKRVVGEIIAYGGATAPTGWLSCDGTAVDRTTYADLFTAIGTTFGVGDGSTTFNVPDLRSRFPVGAGTYAALGEDEGDSEADRTPAHDHTSGTLATASDGSHQHGAGTLTTSDFVMDDLQNTTTGGTAGRLQGSTHNITHNHNVSGSVASGGAHTHTISGDTSTALGASFPAVGVNYLIKT